MYHILVTCGRGFETHVVREIKGKIPDVRDVTVINEGKVCFRVGDSAASAGEPCTPPVLQALYQLKMVERLLLLLFHQPAQAMDQSWLQLSGEQLVRAVCSSVDWSSVTRQVRLLREARPDNSTTVCGEPSLCPGARPASSVQDSSVVDGHSKDQEITGNSSVYHDIVKTSAQKRSRKRKKFGSTQKKSNYSESIITEYGSNGRDSIYEQNKRIKLDFPLSSVETVSVARNKNIEAFVDSIDLLNSNITKKCEPESKFGQCHHIKFRTSCRATGSWRNVFKSGSYSVSYSSLTNNKEVTIPYSNRCLISKTEQSTTFNVQDSTQSELRKETNTATRSEVIANSCDSGSLKVNSGNSDERDQQNRADSSTVSAASSVVHTIIEQLDAATGRHTEDNHCPLAVEHSDKSTEPSKASTSPEAECRDTNNCYNECSCSASTEHSARTAGSTLVHAVLGNTSEWRLCWHQPHVDVYLNITDLHVLLGVSLCRLPLSLRPYIPHISLRSSVCYLMLDLALQPYTLGEHCGGTAMAGSLCSQPSSQSPAETLQSKPAQHEAGSDGVGRCRAARVRECEGASAEQLCERGGDSARRAVVAQGSSVTVLDPMCGTGTILAEAAHCFKVCRVVGCDVSVEQLRVASCNLRVLPPDTVAELITADAARLPLTSSSVQCVVCDFPFGQKHQQYLNTALRTSCCLLAPEAAPSDTQLLLAAVLDECARVVVPGGRVVMLVSAVMEPLVRQHTTSSSERQGSVASLRLLSCHHISLGTTAGLVCVLQVSS